MIPKKIRIKVFRFDPSTNAQPYYQEYEVPFAEGMSALDALDYVYQNLDGTIAYYDHAGCTLGICGKCTAKINGKPGLLCQTPVNDNITIEPVTTEKIVKDLVYER